MKTDYGYNEDDFIEVNGQMQELTVTITLCEYRNLITDNCYSEKAIDELQKENEKIRKERNALVEYISLKEPHIVGKIIEVANEFIKSAKKEREKQNENET